MARLMASDESVASSAGLEQTRDRLLARLHARSDDFAATRELQRVNERLASLPSADDVGDGGVRSNGLSFFDRLRARSRRARPRRGASR
jgi:hypothetical protein